jgi:hypothetical protein
LDDIITHRLPLSQAPHTYEIFNKKEAKLRKSRDETLNYYN